LQVKAVKKMVVQMLGEADLEQLPVHDMTRYKDNLRRLHGLDDDDDVDQILTDVRDFHLLTQVDDRLTRLLGMRREYATHPLPRPRDARFRPAFQLESSRSEASTPW
jgi:hypothetical protein